jgi:monofunctional biosynthetic peptidoglycan transglycosylase
MKRRRSWFRRCVLGALGLVVVWLAVTAAAVAALARFAPPTSAVMWLEPGALGDVDYRWVDRSAIAVAPALAVIASEDQKFLDHHGFDLAELEDAIRAYRAGDGLRGASTISQQVAKNLFLWNGRSFVRKGLEAYFTVLIETLWPKERILEVYLNIAEFGPGIFGVEAAAQRFFGTSASRLASTHAALLAAVLPNPKALSAADPSPYVRTRQAEIDRQMRLLEQRGHYAGLAW